MNRTQRAITQMRQTILAECSHKHQLDPRENDINGDYHVEITFPVHELREFLIATSPSIVQAFAVKEQPKMKRLFRDATKPKRKKP